VIDKLGDPSPRKVTSIAYKENQFILTITSTRMFRQAGFLAKVFEILGRHRVVVDVISTSEISVSLSTDDLMPLKDALAELEQHGQCTIEKAKTVLVVVGRNLARRRGQGADILRAMAQAGTKIDMLSFGMGSINFSMVVDDLDIPKAVPILHQVLFGDG
ncbi:MAG: hypothetical protein PVG60_09090, partial [Desulfarculaceae bacterium]